MIISVPVDEKNCTSGMVVKAVYERAMKLFFEESGGLRL